MEKQRIVIVGAGPAGMMAAIRAAELGAEVVLLEKGLSLGRKLLLTGKGRCNFTNAVPGEFFLERFFHNGEFLRDALVRFSNRDLMDFFSRRGLAVSIQRQQRVFPASEKAEDVLGVLEKELKRLKVKIMFNSVLEDIIVEEKRVRFLKLKDGRILSAAAVILATGGASYQFTGSSGEGISLAGKLGHRIVPLRPGLVPLVVAEDYPSLLEGLTLKNIRVNFFDGKRGLRSPVGELLFTHNGISGPLVLSLSGKVVDWLREKKKVYVEIDLKPALTADKLNQRLLREFSSSARKSIQNCLCSLMPRSLISIFLDICGIEPTKKTAYITNKERFLLIRQLKALRMTVVDSLSLDEAMITQGGVSTKDINPKTMESRLIAGLYFAGEMIDVDADTGGFNLQAAFSTGYLAGESAALTYGRHG